MEKNVPIVSWGRVGFMACFLICALCLVFAIRPLSSISKENLFSSATFMILFFVFLFLGITFLRDWWKKHLEH